MRKIILISFLSLIPAITVAQTAQASLFLKQGLAAAKQAKMPSYKAKALAQVGASYMRAGKTQTAATVFSEAFEAAKKTTMFPRGEILAYVAMEMAQAGANDQAYSAAISWPDSRFKDSALVEIAHGYSSKQNWNQAKQAIEGIKLPRFKALAYSMMSDVLLNRGTARSYSTFTKRKALYQDFYKSQD